MDNKKIILQKIKELILNPTLEKFKEVQVGDMLIQVEGEEFEVGQAVMIKTEEGFIPAGTSLDGSHFIDGVTIVISEGIITEVTQEEPEVEVEVELKEEDSMPKDEETMSKISELEDRIANLEATLVSLSDKLESYEANVSTFSSQMDKLYNNLPAIPKLEEFKTDTSDKTNVISPLESIRSFRTKRK